MASIIIHQHRVCMKISRQTTNRSRNRRPILRVRRSSTPVSVNPNTCHQRTVTRAQEAMEFTRGCHDMEVDPVIATMNFRRTKRVSSNRCRAALRQHQLPAINSQARASGIFHPTTRTTPTSIPLTTTHRWATPTTVTITSRTS